MKDQNKRIAIGANRSLDQGIMAGPTIISIGLVLLCTCATPPHGPAVFPASELPAEVAMNEEAGRGMLLFVKLRLESGEDVSCAVDTGAPTSLLPKSVEPKLGKCLGEAEFSTLDTSKAKERIFAAPKLYLDDTPLVMGSHIGTWDSSMGVLGLDCLRHYCIQLDFDPSWTVGGCFSPFDLRKPLNLLGRPFDWSKKRSAKIKEDFSPSSRFFH